MKCSYCLIAEIIVTRSLKKELMKCKENKTGKLQIQTELIDYTELQDQSDVYMSSNVYMSRAWQMGLISNTAYVL